jgi:hypothetical protein
MPTFPTFSLLIDWSVSGTYTNESAFLREAETRLGGTESPIPAPGVATFTLENGSRRFSPDNAASPLAPHLIPLRPLRFEVNDQGVTRTIFTGWIQTIQPTTGLYGERTVRLVAYDSLSRLAAIRFGLPLQTAQRADQLITLILNATLPGHPAALEVGAETFDIAADRWNSDRTTALDAIRECVQSEVGRFFVSRFGVLTFRGRRSQFAPPSPALTLTTPPGKFTVDRSIDDLYNVINIISHPRDTQSIPGVIAKVTGSLNIPPLTASGAGVRRVRLRFRDPETGQFAGGTALQPLIPYADYLINEQRDGSGVDYTVSPYVDVEVIEVTATQVTVEFRNRAIGPLTLNKLLIRGIAITDYDPISTTRTDPGSVALYTPRTLTVDLPLPNASPLPDSLADYLLDRYSRPLTRPVELVIHNTPLINGASTLALQLEDTIRISDAQSGLNGVLCWIRGQRWQVDGRSWTLTLSLARADDRSYFILERTGHTELDTGTRLGV